MVVRCHSFALGCFEEKRVFTMMRSLRCLTDGLGSVMFPSQYARNITVLGVF